MEKYDGVVEAVHYKPDGQVDWVRVYERRGPTFSDRIIVTREKLIERLKAGKTYMVGRRIPQLAGTFEVSVPIRVVNRDGRDILVTGEDQADRDLLTGVPLL